MGECILKCKMPNVSNASKDKFSPKCGKQFADYVAFCIDCETKL